MKIVIADGFNNADYIIEMLQKQKKRNQIIVINSDKQHAAYLSEHHRIPVFCGNPYKNYVLKNANVKNADIFIALSESDTDNYVSCMLAKTAFNVKKCICIVTDPKNVELFKTLGIDSVVSSTYLLAETIQSESTVEDILKSLSIEDNLIMFEIEVKSEYAIAHREIKDIGFPKNANISCIYRRSKVVIPNGSTLISPGDRLIIVTTPKTQKSIVDFVQTKNEVI